VRAVALLYHDILQGDDADASGLPGAGAAVYKLPATTFSRHIAQIALRVGRAPVREDALDGTVAPWLLTFDDGGVSACHPTLELLALHGWPAHFFITAGFIGRPAFVDAAAIREIAGAGHVIGSHSWSHPARISALPFAQLVVEWRRSTDALAEILGHPVTVASVPGGFHSAAVARAAAEAGVRTLFTSEPVTRVRQEEGGLRVLGRFSIQRSTPAAAAAALAGGDGLVRQRQWLAWNARKLAKRLAGPAYITLRERLLRRP
jgi:peptidoglycan/xylan/chitin deacetylase (PgdA/CDA1 family)